MSDDEGWDRMEDEQLPASDDAGSTKAEPDSSAKGRQQKSTKAPARGGGRGGGKGAKKPKAVDNNVCFVCSLKKNPAAASVKTMLEMQMP